MAATIRISRYAEDEYYFEIHTPMGILMEGHYPVCGDFRIADTVDLVAEYPQVNLLVVGAPDRVNRLSELRTVHNAHPTAQEYTMLRMACAEAGIEFNSTLG